MKNLIVRYTIDEKLYSGARCVVYRGRWDDDGSSIIVKMLRAVPAPDHQVALLKREYELMRSLSIPGVVGCYELVTGPDLNLMLLEDFQGQSLDRLAAAGGIDPLTFLQIAYASAAALAALHERHIVHGNLSPSNIVFNTWSGQLKLIDFGCAVDISDVSAAGKVPRDDLEVSYASPEQAALFSGTDPSSEVDYRSDLYSLGMTLYELLIGHVSLAAGSGEDGAAAPAGSGAKPASGTRNGMRPPPHHVSEDVPARLLEIVLRLIEEDPDRRYQSAAELTADLAAAGMSELPELSLSLRIESARREHALRELQEAYEEVQTQEEAVREQQQELIATRAQIETERQRYQQLFALAPDGYLVTDLHGIILEANEAAAALLEVDPRLISGALLARFVPTREERRGFFNFLKQMRKSDATVEWEGRLAPHGSQRTGGREPVDVVMRCSAIRDSDGVATEARWLIRDVTASKRASELLRFSEERFRTLTENGQDVTYRVKLLPSISLDYISPSVTALTGFTPEELYASPDLTNTLIAPGDRLLVEARASHPDKWVGPQALRWLHKDGSDIWVEQRNAPIYDEAGKVVGITGVARDITARKLAEAALEERDLLIHKITTTVPHFIYVFDVATQRAAYTNHKLADVLGYTFEEGQTLGWDEVIELVHPDDKPRAAAYMEELASAADNAVPSIAVRMRDAWGQYRWIAARYAILARSADGTPAQLLGTLADITERKEVENALRESEARFRTSVEHLQDAFGIFSAVRDEAGDIIDFKIEYMNPVAALISRLSAEEQVGRMLREFLPEERWSLFFDEYRQVVETGEPRKFESVSYDGPYGNHHLSVALDISAARFGDGFIATWRDVTERKQREELLFERERFIAHVAGVTPGIIFVYDIVERRILYVNDQVTSLTGLTPQQVVELGPSVNESLLYSESVPRADVLEERVMGARDGEVVEFEIKVSHINAGSSWLMARAVVFSRDEGGAPTQMLAVAYDISERKRIEDTVRQANADLYARVGELSALSRISQILTTITDLSSSLPTVCRTLLDIFKASQVSVSELSSTRSELTVLADVRRGRADIRPDMTGRTIALDDDPVARRAVEEEQPTVIHGGVGPPADGSPTPGSVNSLMVLPLRSRGTIIGLLSIASDRADIVWSPLDVRLGQTVAGTVAGAIETARLFGEELKQRLLAESLNEVGAVLTGSLDSDTVVHTIFEQLKRVLDYEGASLHLRDGDDLVVTQAVGIAARYVRYRFPADSKGPQINVLETGQARCISDTEDYENWTPPGANDTMRSWMGAPLVIGDRILGILTVSHTQRNMYTAPHLHLLQSFANEAAIAINNATRYQEAHDVAAYEERNRLARELHDSVTQSLFSANLIAKVLPDLAQQNPGRYDQALETLARLTESALTEMRTMLLELRPTSLAQMPLDLAFKNLTLTIRSRSPLEIVHSVFDPTPTLPDDVQLALYRIVQETLTNVEKHSQARRVEFSLRVLPPFQQGSHDPWTGEIAVHIADDGKGFDIRAIPPGHLGLQIMSERASSIGAKLEMTSKPGRGTQITIIWVSDTA